MTVIDFDVSSNAKVLSSMEDVCMKLDQVVYLQRRSEFETFLRGVVTGEAIG
jgi:hypothetical protein